MNTEPPARPRALVARLHLDVVIMAALSVAASLPFGHLFVSADAMVVVVGAIVLAAGVTLATSARCSLGPVIAAGVTTLALYVTFVVYHVGIPTGSTLGDVWRGVTGSWAALLTAPIPAAALPELSALPVVAAWSGCAVGTILTLRTRSTAWPVAAPLGVLVVALLFSGGRAEGSGLFVGITLLLVLLFVFVRVHESQPRSSGGVIGAAADASDDRRALPTRTIVGVGSIVLAAIASTVAVPYLSLTSAAERTDLHDHYDAPYVIDEAVSPLSQVRVGQDDTSGRRLFTVTTSQPVDRLELAVLGDYDGTVWGSGNRFSLAGKELARPTGQGDVITQQFSGVDVRSPFLPHVGRPLTIDQDGFGTDRTTGMLVAGSDRERPLDYTLTSTFVTPDAAREAVESQAPDLTAEKALPEGGLPAAFDAVLAEIPRVPDDVNYFEGMVAYLQSARFAYDEDARPGHSVKVLADFLGAASDDGSGGTSRVGHDEQFVSTMALLARMRGFASHVVVGYQLEQPAADTPIDVHPDDITTWVEVYIPGTGWVPFDPRNRTPGIPEVKQQPPPPPTTTAVGGPDETVPTDGTVPVGGSGNSARGQSRTTTLVVVPLLLVVVATIAAAAAIVGVKRLVRRARRTRGSTTERVLGAWREARDRLRTHGVDVPRTSTLTELSDATDPAVASSVRDLAPHVDRALYARAAPDDAAVDAAWDAERAVGDAVTSGAGVRTAVRAALDPRPLVDCVRRR